MRVVDSVGNYDEEMERTKKYIERDIFNNSPWTYRGHCFAHLKVKDLKGEIGFVLEQIEKQIDNEASWNYLRGLFPSHKLRGIDLNHSENFK